MKRVALYNVYKHYRLYTYVKSGLKSFLFNFPKSIFDLKNNKYEVLKDISFEVMSGEGFGVVGKNGSGKSTLLMLIAGVIKPDRGKIDINGKVIPLLELGAGFNYELTGIENIYLNGILLGYDRGYIKRRLDDIIEFSELGDFIFQPLKFYSSGMVSRLAFSIAVFLEGDIILIDEILAVGDSEFQKKSKKKIKELKNKGTTIILVSHSPADIEYICDRAIYIKDHKIFFEGKAKETLDVYLNDNSKTS